MGQSGRRRWPRDGRSRRSSARRRRGREGLARTALDRFRRLRVALRRMPARRQRSGLSLARLSIASGGYGSLYVGCRRDAGAPRGRPARLGLSLRGCPSFDVGCRWDAGAPRGQPHGSGFPLHGCPSFDVLRGRLASLPSARARFTPARRTSSEDFMGQWQGETPPLRHVARTALDHFRRLRVALRRMPARRGMGSSGAMPARMPALPGATLSPPVEGGS
jgi:hypothetical protein